MKTLFVSMSVKQNLFVSVFVHKCLMMLNDVEYTTFKMFLTQMSNYRFVISFQLIIYKTLRYRLARALRELDIEFHKNNILEKIRKIVCFPIIVQLSSLV